MAGDWIKMRGNLWDDPRVSKLCDLTDSSEACIVGGLYWLWATADQHSENGIMAGLTLRAIDRKVGIPGFGQALCDIGWLADHPEGVRIIRFNEHNGASAKRRSLDAQRKANIRSVSASDADSSQTEGGQNAPDCGAREREEKRKKGSSETSRPKGSRMTLETLPDDWRKWATETRPDLDPAAVWDRFADYWRAKPGSAGVKLDWLATWRNWVREQRVTPTLVKPKPVAEPWAGAI